MHLPPLSVCVFKYDYKDPTKELPKKSGAKNGTAKKAAGSKSTKNTASGKKNSGKA
jgi:hypothetical protein